MKAILIVYFASICLAYGENQELTSDVTISPVDRAAKEIVETKSLLGRDISIEGGVFKVAALDADGSLCGRSKWISEMINATVLPNTNLENQTLHVCLEFLRSKMALRLIRTEQLGKSIHFVRTGLKEPTITIDAKDWTVRKVLDEIGRQSNMRVNIFDYGIVLTEQN